MIYVLLFLDGAEVNLSTIFIIDEGYIPFFVAYCPFVNP